MEKKIKNDINNPQLFVKDILPACIVSMIISPMVVAIDSTIVENTHIQRTPLQNLSVATKKYTLFMKNAFKINTAAAAASSSASAPKLITKPLAMMFLVYTATFATFNWTNRHYDDEAVIITATTAVNGSLGIIKDKIFVDTYGKPQPYVKTGTLASCKHGISLHPWYLIVKFGGFGMFILRDLSVLGSSFILPKKIAQFLTHESDKFNASTVILDSNDTSKSINSTIIITDCKDLNKTEPAFALNKTACLYFTNYESCWPLSDAGKTNTKASDAKKRVMDFKCSATYNDTNSSSLCNTDSLSIYNAYKTMAQVIVPLATQVIITPLHLMGIMMVNSSHGTTPYLSVVRNCFINTFLAKSMRIVPTFILGTMGNNYLCDWYHRKQSSV